MVGGTIRPQHHPSPVDGRLQVLLNQRADVRATQEGRHPGHDGFFGAFVAVMDTFSGDFSYQDHPVTPPNGMSELDFIGALLDSAQFYRNAEAANPIPYGATSTNCNRFMNSFLISLGLPGTHDFGDHGVTLPFGVQPFETTFDIQNATTLPPEYFPPNQNRQTQSGDASHVPNAANR